MFVYLIHQIGSKFYKIGRSKDLKERLRALQPGNPQPLDLIAAFNVARFASQVELDVHTALAIRRLFGEWFALTDEDVNEFGNLVAQSCPEKICYQHQTVFCAWCHATGGDGYYPKAAPRS